MSLLPPNASPLETALEQAGGRLSDVPMPIRDLWNPKTCPRALLPWLAWGVSIDFWDTNWTQDRKRAEIANAIAAQRCKGTRGSLRQVLDRFDPLIAIVEWFDDRQNLEPHTFRLELPLLTDGGTDFTAELIGELLRDIAVVKPLRAHMFAVHRLKSRARMGLLGASTVAGSVRSDLAADVDAANDPAWATYLRTEDGEPFEDEAGTLLEAA